MFVGQIIALAVIAGICIISALLGAYALRRALPTAHDFYTAGGALGGVVLSFSVIASIVSYVTFFGNASLGFRTGLGAVSVMGVPGIPMALVWYAVHRKTFVLSKVRNWMSVGAVYDARYGPGMGALIAWLLFAATLPYLGAQIQATGVVMQALGLPYWSGTIFVLVFILFYTALGGFRGTTYVHVFQTIIFFSLAMVLFGVVLAKSGGLASVTEHLLQQRPQLFQIGAAGGKVWSYPMLLSYGLGTIAGFTCMPVAFMHTYACRSLSAFKTWTLSFGLATLILTVFMVLLGIIGRSLLPDLQGLEIEGLYPRLAYLLLPSWGAVVILAGTVAAGMATLDNVVFGNAMNLVNDWYRRLARPSERQLIWAGRLAMVCIVVVGGILVAVPKFPLAELNVLSFSATGMLFFSLTGGYFWKGATRVGAISSALVGMALVYFLSLVWPGQGPGPSPNLGGLTPFLVSFPICGLTFFCVSWITRRAEQPPGAAAFFDPSLADL